MLETGSNLATWQVSQSPVELAPGQSIEAKKLPDHRKDYLTYQGPVSRGRGEVKILECGEFEPRSQQEDYWEIELVGETFRGRFTLHRLHGDDWTLQRL